MTNNEDGDETLRAAIRDVMGHPIVGSFVMVATVYDDDGDARTAIKVSEDTTLTEQLGLLGQALNRANMIDTSGWTSAMGEESD